MTQGTSPPQQMTEKCDHLVMAARTISLRYLQGEKTEDDAREWLGEFALLACKSLDLTKHRATVEAVIAAGRKGDAAADRAVAEGAADVIVTAEEARAWWLECWAWLKTRLGYAQAAGALVPPRAA